MAGKNSTPNPPGSFGEWLRQARRSRGLSLRALGAALQVHYVYLSQLERGVERPSEQMVHRLAAFFGHPDPHQLLLLAGKLPGPVREALQRLLQENSGAAQAVLRRLMGGESAAMSRETVLAAWREEARRQWMFHIHDTVRALRELESAESCKDGGSERPGSPDRGPAEQSPARRVSAAPGLADRGSAVPALAEMEAMVREGQHYFDADEPGKLWRQIARIRHALRQHFGYATFAPLLGQGVAEDDASLIERMERLDEVQNPERPSSWEGLRRVVPAWPADEEQAAGRPAAAPPGLDLAEYRDRTLAGWLGKLIGGALGTPVEGWPADRIAAEYGEIRGYLRPPDTFNDDTTYELAFLAAMERTAGNPTSIDLGLEWVERIPVACTAEEMALRNLQQGILPPLSAWLNNPYAEWIGAQMRGEIMGFIAPNQPERAAALAWRDARISHLREGMYGEVFNAVMVSLAYARKPLRELVEEALRFVPPRSLFAQAVRETMAACEEAQARAHAQPPAPADRAAWRQALAAVEDRWVKRYHWVHTLASIPAVIIGLWFGVGPGYYDSTVAEPGPAPDAREAFSRTITITTMCGGDADCTAGQAGAIAGVMLGSQAIGPEWRDPLGDVMESWVWGMERLRLEELVERTCRWGWPDRAAGKA